MKRTFVFVASLALLYASPGYAASWVSGSGRSCDNVCGSPVVSGTYVSADARMNGQKFFVCRANVGDGSRAGYNLRPNWSRTCTVGHGGAEKSLGSYSCLCN
jgi:hypothetical protein